MATIASPQRSVCAFVSERLAEKIGRHLYNMWFDETARLVYDDKHHRLHIGTPNKFVRDWIREHFREHVHAAAAEQFGSDVELRFDVEADAFADKHPRSEAHTPAAGAPDAGPAPTAPPVSPSAALRHRLDDYVVGPSNELAYAAAHRLADSDDDAHGCSPLFIHGKCGLGKTHLLQGICSRWHERNPRARVRYTTGEQFTNEFLAVVRSNQIETWRRSIRQLDLLAIDDVHFLASRVKTQQEFLHCFDAIELSGARIVMASDNHPKLIEQFSESLVSRCIRGMVVEVRPPDLETRRCLVRALAGRRRMPLMDNIIDTLANRAVASVRDIEGMLTKLQALAAVHQHRRTGVMRNDANATVQPIGHAIVNRLFESEMSEVRPRVIRFEDIVDSVTQQLAVTRSQILSSTRQRQVVLARSMVIHLARRMTSMSYPEIAAAMGRRNHSTMITAAQRVEKQIREQTLVMLTGTTFGSEPITMSELAQRLQYGIARG